MTPRSWISDEVLLAELGEVVGSREPVPRPVVDAAKAAFRWRSLGDDRQLAVLTYDSWLDPAAPVRTAAGAVRVLSFQASVLAVELAVGVQRIDGRLLPPAPGAVALLTVLDGVVARAGTDERGCFVLPPPPACPVLLACEAAKARIGTEWARL